MQLMKTPKICELWTSSLEVVWRRRSVEELELPNFWQAFHGHCPAVKSFTVDSWCEINERGADQEQKVASPRERNSVEVPKHHEGSWIIIG